MPLPPLDEVDSRIVDALERDGRLSMRQLAEQLHISRANAYARVERLRRDRVITGFAALIDPVARGFGTSAYVTLTIRQADWRDIRKSLLSFDGVMHMALVGGGFDVILLVRANDNAGLRDLVLGRIQGIPGVLGSQTLLVFEEAGDPVRGTGSSDQP